MTLASEISISPQAYDFIRGLVYRHARIRLGEEKQTLVVSRLGKRLRHLGLNSFEAYCGLLDSHHGEVELRQLVDLISTNHTHFFREGSHFDFLGANILSGWSWDPARAQEPFRVWSAACSSGEEPYSIAIVLAEFFRIRPAAAWVIEATDISGRMIERARVGVYDAGRVQLPRPEWLRRYFQKGVGRFEGTVRVKPELRSNVTFHQMNLLQAQYPVASDHHVIFCRNVMIYFDQDTQQELVERLIGYLRPGGFLIVGHSESLLGIRHTLKTVGPAIYCRE